MHKINLKEAQTCLADLVQEAEQGEDVIIIRDDGLSFKLVMLSNTSHLNQTATPTSLFDPEGIWRHTDPITDEIIAEARKEMWQKFDTKDS